ncbi:MAG: hypothetical protein M1835_004901 [Candelina submexicana]|nr:MAG: hypothetical protein M1835_004901 [Candelina submexicana]
MRIFILGGNGRTGKLVVEEALQRGHTITALVRNPTSLNPQKGLTIVKGKQIPTSRNLPKQPSGTPLSQSDIATAFSTTPNEPPSAVISTLNASRVSDNPWSAVASPPRMMADSVANCVAVMKQYSVTRIAIMSAFGVGDSWPNLVWLMRWVIGGSNMRYQYEDHNLVEREVRGMGVDYVLVRPCRLSEAEKLPVRVWGDTGRGVGVGASVGRRCVAGFLVDCVEGGEWVGRTPVISN